MPGQLGGFALAMRVHEAFLRLHKTLQRDEQITSPRAYITTLAIRLIIDQIRSARARRERYIGEGLPEPVVTEPTPAEQAETVDSLSLAFLVVVAGEALRSKPSL